MLEDLHRAATGKVVLSQELIDQINQLVCSPAHRAVEYAEQLIADLKRIAVYEDAAIAFETLARDLAEQFLLVVLIAGVPGQRRVLKFEYEDECRIAYSYRRAGQEKGFRQFVRALKAIPTFIAVHAGLEPLPITLGVRDVAYALSYHIEIPSPDGLYLLRASLDKDVPGSWEQLVYTGASERAHLYLYDQPRSVKTRVQAHFCMDPSGWPALGLTSAGLTFAILAGGLILHQFFGRHPDTGGAPAVLAVLPGVLAALYLRSGEHPILRWMIRGIRVFVVLLIAIALASAGMLAVRPGPAVWAWLCLTVSALVLFCVLVVIFAKTWRRSPDKWERPTVIKGPG